MKQIIKFVDVDVDGCGTDVVVYVQVEGKRELANGIIENCEKKIEDYKKENLNQWDTDSVLDMVCGYLETEGYMCDSIIPDYEFEF